MTHFERKDFRNSSRYQSKEDMSSAVGRKGGKPQVAIYRPGSGPLRKSAFGEEEHYGEGFNLRSEQNNLNRERREGQYGEKNNYKKLFDDFDNLSICSNNSSHKGGENSSLRGSFEKLSDSKRRTKKPEAPIYVPPKPPSALSNNLENKTFKTRNYSNTKRSDSFQRNDPFRRDSKVSLLKESDRDRNQCLDNRSLRSESEPPKSFQEPGRENDKVKNRKVKKTKKKNGRREKKDENLNQTNENKEKVIPLMDIKFDYNPSMKSGNTCDVAGYENSGYTTTDGENERDSLYITQHAYPLQHRNLRQASEPRSLPLSSVQIVQRGRDTRSVEPGDEIQWQQGRSNQKPPIGQYRRANKPVHSKHKQYHMSFEFLPPRLQKKYIEEYGLQELNDNSQCSNIEKTYLGSNPDLRYGGADSEPSYNTPPLVNSSYLMSTPAPAYVGMNTTYIGTNSEDAWDGGSLTFQGNNQTFYSSVPPPSIFSHPPPPLVSAPHHLWSQTLPNVKGRGRGRVPHHELERERLAFEEARMTRSLTPNAFGELMKFEETQIGLSEHLIPAEEKGSSQSVNNFDAVTLKEKEEKSSDETNSKIIYVSENEITKPKSPVQTKSPQDVTFKKPTGTGMNWADEVELSEQLQEKLEGKGSENDLWSLTTSNISPLDQTSTVVTSTTSVPQKDRRRRRKRSNSRERLSTREDRRNSLDEVTRESRRRKNSGGDRSSMSRSRKNSEDGRHWPRSRKNSEDDRIWPRSRKNSEDDRHWPRSRKNSCDDRNWRNETREPFDNFRVPRIDNKFSSSRNSSRNNSRNNSRSNSRSNSVERWTHDEYLNFNGSERKIRGNSGDQFQRNSVKNHPNSGRRRGSRDISTERMKEPKQEENWREEARRLNGPGPLGGNKRQEHRKPAAGILVLPPSTSPTKETDTSKHGRNTHVSHTQKQLFDPSNPHKPLIVNTPVDSSRNVAQFVGNSSQPYVVGGQIVSSDGHFISPMAHPMPVLHNPDLLKEAEFIDYELSHFMFSNSWYEYHDDIIKRRSRLQEILWVLLTSDIKFCEQENLEHYFWKILYYNLLEWFRKQMSATPHHKEAFMNPMLNIIDEGTKYFENTLRVLEDYYKFNVDDLLVTGFSSTKAKTTNMTKALTSAQKILLFLGHLARYREQVHDSANFGVARQWYMKAQQLNPKNGAPYYQLALLAVNARRKLDAVYYYMRSLIATIPSAKESLLTIFDENRRKFEQSERQRHEEREAREREKMKEKECDRSNRSHQLRREIWIHPEGGRRVHRTTSTSTAHTDTDSEAELGALPHLELSKRFSMSFIHVHGKLFTKIGMESFQCAALQMLRQLRALLQHSPLPITSTRLLQLLALNMFAIDNTQLKNNELGPGYRSAMQESALIVSLQMFSIILERAVQLLKDQQNNSYRLIVSDDVQILLPSIKVWCDWLLCHSSVWNPPPSCHDYGVGPTGDVWARFATLVNLLERVDYQQHLLSEHHQEDYVQVRLAEDAALAGFVPLMFNCPEPMFTSKETNMEVAQISLRIHRILFCGTVFLCGVDPPVLKLHKNETGNSEYISVVETPSPPTQSDGELCVESISGGDSQDSGQASEDEAEGSPSHISPNAGGEIQSLLQRKQELERSHRQQEKRRQKVQSILQSTMVSVEIEVRPHYLVADTNCFIDYLPQLQIIAKASSPSQPHIYTLMVPLVVLNELDGLAHGRRDPGARPEHRAMVTESAAFALEFLRSKSSPAIRCVTTRGTVLNSAAFTSEEDCQDLSNDDKILTTCLKLCHSSQKEEQVEGQPRKIWRDVVLLTEDRNLRVKALARDVPVREVLDFLRWAGLESG